MTGLSDRGNRSRHRFTQPEASFQTRLEPSRCGDRGDPQPLVPVAIDSVDCGLSGWVKNPKYRGFSERVNR